MHHLPRTRGGGRSRQSFRRIIVQKKRAGLYGLARFFVQYDIIIDRKEVNALSKRKKKRGNKAEPDSYLNLVTAILNLVIAILLLIEKLTE